MKVYFKKTAIDDIQESVSYIAEKLHNVTAANKLADMIFDTAMLLEDNPYMGTTLSGKYPVETDLRYFVVAKRMIFYRVINDERIEVTRVLDGRQDYMSILF